MTKARDLANIISTGNPLSDGALSVAEVTGAAPLASPTFTGTATAPTINASTALQIGGTAITVGASDINTVTAKAPSADPTFTGDVTLPDKIVHTGDTNTAIRFPADDTVAFETAGSERFRFASAGQLGIAGANYGTSGQVLQSGGASGAASWADAGGGAYELIQKQTISSSVSSITFTNTTAPQEQLLLLFNGVQLSGQGHIRMNLQDANGNNLTGGSYAGVYNTAQHYHTVGSSHGVGSTNNNQNLINLTEGAQIIGGFGYNAHFFIFEWTGSAGANPHFSGRAAYRFGGNSTSFINNMIVANYSSSGSTPARIYIYSSANFTTGEIYLYKLV